LGRKDFFTVFLKETKNPKKLELGKIRKRGKIGRKDQQRIQGSPKNITVSIPIGDGQSHLQNVNKNDEKVYERPP